MTGNAIAGDIAEVVGLMARRTFLEDSRAQATVHCRQCIRVRVAPGGSAGLLGVARGSLFVRVVTRSAGGPVRFVGWEVGKEHPHLMTGDTLVPSRLEESDFDLAQEDVGLRAREGMATDAVYGEMPHSRESHLGVLVATGLRAGLARGRKLVDRGGVALHAHQALQVGLLRLQVDLVPG
jgi:hypothetical protein